jgi:hypothetical protein
LQVLRSNGAASCIFVFSLPSLKETALFDILNVFISGYDLLEFANVQGQAFDLLSEDFFLHGQVGV